MPDQIEMMKRQRVLGDFGDFTLYSDDLDDVLTEACRLVGEALGTGRAKVLEIQDENGELLVRAGVGWGPNVVGRVRLSLSERSSETYSIRQAKPVMSRDVRSDERFDIPAFMREAGVVAMVNVPIFLPGRKPYGLLQVDASEPREFGAADVEFLRTYASILGPVIDRLIKVGVLRSSEERYRAFVTASSDVVYRMSPDWSQMRQLDGRGFLSDTVEPNEAWMDHYIHSDDQATVREAIERAIRTKTMFELEHRVVRADGGLGWTLSRAVPILDGRGEIVEWLGAASDVTRRREVEEAVRESDERKAFLLALSDGLRPLSDPVDIQRTATRLLGEHMGASRVFYVVVDGDGDTADILGDYTNGVPSRVGRYSLSAFSTYALGEWRAGRFASSSDVDTDPRYSETERVAYASVSTRAGFGIPLIKEGQLVALLGVNQSTPRHWTGGDIDLAGDIAERTWATLERARAETILRESEERQAFLLQLSDALRPLSDPTEIQYAAMKLLAERYDVMRAGYLDVHADGDTMTMAAYVQRDGVPAPLQIRLSDYGPDLVDAFRAGSTMCVRDTEADTETEEQRAAHRALGIRSWIIAPLVKGGRLTAIVGVVSSTARDWTPAEVQLVTDLAQRTWDAAQRARLEDTLRESEAQLQVMVAELQHRTRNLIGVVEAIALQTMAETGPGEAFMEAYAERLRALSRVQGLLSRAGEERVTLREVIEMELSALGAAVGERVRIKGTDVPLRKSTVQTLALAVHELATNARKYGALAGDRGELSVCWVMHERDGEERRLRLEWIERGVDVKVEDGTVVPQGGGYGRQLIEKALPYSLKARTTYDLGPDGLLCTIDLPLGRPSHG